MGLINSQNPTSATTPDGQELINKGTAQGYVVSDGTNPRVIVGFNKGGFDGEDYGIKVSQEGYDVTSTTDNHLVMSSAFNMFKIFMSGTVSITNAGGAGQVGTTTVTHNLGYSPVVFGNVTLPGSLSSEVMAFPGAYYVGAPLAAPKAVFEYFAANPNTLTIQLRTESLGGTYTFKYYIMVETST